MATSFYEILGVSRNAEATVIEAAYRALMKRYHPDTRTAGGRDRSAAINEAYSVLRDPTKRAAYDALLDRKSNSIAKGPTKSVAAHEPSPQIDQTRQERKRCPDCAELIQAQARVCRYCGAAFTGQTKEQRSAFIEFWRKRTRWWDWLILGIVGLVILIAYVTSPNRHSESTELSTEAQTHVPQANAESEWDEYLDPPLGARVLWRPDNSIQYIQFYRGRQASQIEGCALLPVTSATVLSVDEEQGTFRGRSGNEVTTFHVPFEQVPEVVGSWLQQMIKEGAVLKVSSAACGASGSTIVVTGLQNADD